MDNHHNTPASPEEAARFTTKEDIAARMADDAAVNFARQVSDWSKDNLARFDNDGNNRVNFGELDLGKRTSHNGDDKTALNYMQEHYNEIQKHSQNRFLFIKGAGGISTDGIDEYAKDLEQRRDENAKQLSFQLHERALQADSRELVSPLMANDGNPNNSLFRVIDSLDGDIDNKISKKDLNRYLDEYQQRARYGDIGSGFFTPDTRRYVEGLRDNWDSQDVVRLRGTWTSHEHDGQDREIPNSKISEESLKNAIGVSKNGDMYAPFVADRPMPVAPPEPVETKPLPEAKPAPVEEKAAPKPVVEAKPAPVVEAPKPVAHADHKAGKEHSDHKHKHVAEAKPAPVEAKPVAEAKPAPVEAKPVAEAKPAPVEAKPVAEAKPAPQANDSLPPMEIIQTPPPAPEAAAATEPGSVINMVAGRMQENYAKTEQEIAKINAEDAARDTAAVNHAVHMHEWGKDNLRRFDTSGDNRVNYGELDLGARTSRGEDRHMLRSIQAEYEMLKQQSGGGFLFVQRPDAVSQKDLRVNVEKKVEAAENNERARQQATDMRAEQNTESQILAGLLATPDGNPNRSLFRVIDGMDNDIDNEIGKKDLHRYMNQYENRSRYGDVGHGFFTGEIRDYVQTLAQNWDSPEIKTLRGTYRDNDNREQTHDKINLNRLKQLLGMRKDENIFDRFSLEHQ